MNHAILIAGVGHGPVRPMVEHPARQMIIAIPDLTRINDGGPNLFERDIGRSIPRAA
jgi:hypothetical protein